LQNDTLTTKIVLTVATYVSIETGVTQIQAVDVDKTEIHTDSMGKATITPDGMKQAVIMTVETLAMDIQDMVDISYQLVFGTFKIIIRTLFLITIN